MEESAEEVGRIEEGSSIFSILVIFANDRLGCGFAYLEPREPRKPRGPREPRKPVWALTTVVGGLLSAELDVSSARST